jgi:hypothetical protein
VTQTQTLTSVVTVTTSTVETVPVPPPKPHHIRVDVKVKWRYNGAVTRLEWLKVGRKNRHTQLTVFYKQERNRRHQQMREATSDHQVRSLIHWLESWRYRPGDRLWLKISRPGYIPERANWTIRDGQLPKLSS